MLSENFKFAALKTENENEILIFDLDNCGHQIIPLLSKEENLECFNQAFEEYTNSFGRSPLNMKKFIISGRQ